MSEKAAPQSRDPRVASLRHLVVIHTFSPSDGDGLSAIGRLQAGDLLSLILDKLSIEFDFPPPEKFIRPRVGVLVSGKPEDMEIVILILGCLEHVCTTDSIGRWWGHGSIDADKLNLILDQIGNNEIVFVVGYHCKELWDLLLPCLGITDNVQVGREIPLEPWRGGSLLHCDLEANVATVYQPLLDYHR